MSSLVAPNPAEAADFGSVLNELAELGPPSEVRNGSPSIVAAALGFDRVLLSSVQKGSLIAEALHLPDAGKAPGVLARLRQSPVALEYPLVEGEIMRRRRAHVVPAPTPEEFARHAFADIIGWSDHVAAPIFLDASIVGFFHADREQMGRTVDERDAAALTAVAACFALVYERAVLRQRLRIQRHEMRRVAGWADARAGELGGLSVTLAEGEHPDEGTGLQPSGVGAKALRDLLTRRELEVLQLMVRGETNAAIAKDLVVAEGTVKFHVKNVLRKLHASNRAEATSRYLRLTLGHTDTPQS